MRLKIDQHNANATSQAKSPKPTLKLRRPLGQARLCWTRHDLVQATGLCYRSLVNLENRGLLRRCCVGLNVACYTDASVRAVFSDRPPLSNDQAG